MRIHEIEFPIPLLEAQRAGDLVVFAGAGVSIPAPSNYPDFDSLADEVASGVLAREQQEPVDHFLGRLAHRGIDVHGRVRSLLSNPSSTPNALHYDLLRLFTSASTVRLATTNFDLHFSSAAATVFKGESAETYSAPALPVGDSFNGIVYLHGSVEKAASRLILTDSDFGRAYLTEGWARRFLQALFARYVVLFIGYSHSDTVMNYLTRGLPPASGQTRRYALTKVGQADRWNYLGITPLEYTLAEAGEDKHCRLREAVSKWAIIANTGTLETEEKIKRIVEGPVPLDIEELDYVDAALAQISTVRFFTRHANRLDWLHWIEDKGPFLRLFRSDTTFTDSDWELARWFAQSFVCKHPDSALAVVRRKGQLISPILWTAIAASFHTNEPPSEVVKKWIPLLIKYPTPRSGGDFLEYTLHRSKYPNDLNSALLLFDYLTRPDIVLEERWWPDQEGKDESVAVELTTEGDDPWVSGVWEQFFKPNLSTVANTLIWIVTSNLQRANLLLEAYEKVHPNWDALSTQRGMLESVAQGTPPKGVGILIGVARELLEWTLLNQTRTADFLIDAWFSSNCRILMRLAIFGAAKAKHWDCDTKIKWILQHDLLYAPGFKREVFMMLENAYGAASEYLQRQMLDRASGGPNLAGLAPESIAYEEYNLILWLATHAPESSLTKAKLSEILEKHPTFGPREHPDMDRWFASSTFSTLNSPVSYEELLAKSPEDQLDRIISFEPKDLFRESREGLLQQFSMAVAHDFDWGMRFATAMAGKQLWKPDVWVAIIEGWKSSVTADQWPKIIQFLRDHEEVLQAAVYVVAHLLDDGAEKPDRAIPDTCVADAVALAEKAWNACAQSNVRQKDEAKDWLFVALNHPAGTLALFFLRMLSKARKNAGAEWKGIPANYEKTFASIVSGTTKSAELGRVMLASQLMFLFLADSTWTVENIVPLFRWSSNPRRALQAWHGYLGWGQWNDSLLVSMMPNYEDTFPVLHAEFGEFRERLCSHLAGIAILSSVDPLEQGWINRFLTTVRSEERELWASSVTGVLKGVTEGSKTEIWNRWLGKYWRHRIDGIPLPLSAEEVARMALWVAHLEPVLGQAVDALCGSPAPKLESDYIYYELAESDIGKRHPTSSSKFLLHLLRKPKRPVLELRLRGERRREDIVRSSRGQGRLAFGVRSACHFRVRQRGSFKTEDSQRLR